jgi:hypothetical protein
MIDIYKGYIEQSEIRKLEKEERMEMKENQRLADVFTPLLKLIAAENSNQIAYDALQVHGGAGFMKDFPIERLYRDARITTIYEGTSQLQVVAAIKGVTNGAFLKKIREYESVEVIPELEDLRRRLLRMTHEYEVVVEEVRSLEDDEYLDFHARRLVEMAGNIVMGHLLVLDALRNSKFKYIAELFIKKAMGANKQCVNYIGQSELRDLGTYKQLLVSEV